MSLDINIGDGADALTINQLTAALNGTYWVSGWEASLGEGDLEVEIAPGEGAIGTIDVETESTQTVDFSGDVDAEDPRKAVISVDDTGTVQKSLGDPVAADPEGEIRERTFDPQPPTNAPGVVVAEVWLAAGATSLVSDDIRDRRLSNEVGELPDVEGLSTQGDEGTAPVSQGDGTLAMGTPTAAPGWVEDDNSPFIVSDEEEATYTIAGDYDRILLMIDSSTGFTNLRVNGITNSEYDLLDVQGNIIADENSWDLDNVMNNYDSMILRLGSLDRIQIRFNQLRPSSTALICGSTDSTGQTLDSFTLFRDGVTQDAKIDVYGRVDS